MSVEPVGKKQIALVIPVFNEEENIQEFYKDLSQVLEGLPAYEWKFLFVDDGSEDGSVNLIKDIIGKDPRVGLIEFSKNFGKEAALSAGVRESLPYDSVIALDADLQHPPQLIGELVKSWEKGNSVVVGVRRSVESHSMFRKLGSNLYYFLMRGVDGTNIIPKSTDFRLIDKQVIEEFIKLPEKIKTFRGSIDWFGFNTDLLPFDAPQRFGGSGTYSYARLFNLAINSITSFSLWPLKITGYMGLAISFFSFLLLLTSLVVNIYLSLWVISPLTLFVIFNTFLVGVLMSCLGLIALYIGNINNEVLNRPNYVIAKKTNVTD